MIHCDWNAPGVNPYMGTVVAAIQRYTDIPPAARAELQKKAAARHYDDIAVISRDAIEGAHKYTGLRDMHFGKGKVCRAVNRSKWPADASERGLVYCAESHCIIIPTVCRNVSRVTRLTPPLAAQPGLPMESFGTLSDVPAPLEASRTPQEETETFEAGIVPPGQTNVTTALYGPVPLTFGDTPAVTPVPEPGTWALMLAGLLTVIRYGRKKHANLPAVP